MNERFGLKQDVIDRVCAVLAKYPQVEKAIIYGSRAKGIHKKGSDVDLTLVGEDLTLDVLFRIMDDIDDLLLPYTFDVSIFHTIEDQDVVEHISRVGKIFYEKQMQSV